MDGWREEEDAEAASSGPKCGAMRAVERRRKGKRRNKEMEPVKSVLGGILPVVGASWL